jgi:shikimate 5-dehydrogenase
MDFISKSDEFMPEYSMEVKQDAMNLIRELKDDAKEISLRTLISVSKIRASNKDWKDLAEYMLVA